MSVFFALVRRELGGHFNSLTGYVVIAAVLLLTGFGLVDLIERIRQMPYDAPVTELFYQTTYFWLVVLLTSPVITMRTYAAEKATGTYEALMTTPVGDWQVVLAKFAGALVFFLLTWVPFIGVLFSLRQITGEAALFEPVIVAVTFLGIALVGGLFMAVGCFASALTRSEIIAAMVAFLFGIGLWMLGYRPEASGMLPAWAVPALEHMSMTRHMEDFARGMLVGRYVVYYVTVTGLFLFLTHRIVQSRRWK
jgi:ABC-2 type transport system permease protein